MSKKATIAEAIAWYEKKKAVNTYSSMPSMTR